MANKKKPQTTSGYATRQKLGLSQLNVSLTPEDLDLIKRAASMCGMQQKDWVVKKLVLAAQADLVERSKKILENLGKPIEY